MWDVAIIGGGVGGLALARNLRRLGKSVVLFEARERLGGRVMTVTGAGTGVAMDLGAGWFWPDAQPLMRSLIADLGLISYPQFEDGDVLQLADPETAPEAIEERRIYDGARRLAGGMTALVDALAATMPADALRFGHSLVGVQERGDHVALGFAVGNRTVEFETRRAVLAFPPRLIAQHVRFEPELDETTREALSGAPTWMAQRAKATMAYEQAFWRTAGHSGSAFVTHDQAVFAEMFDACDATGDKAALGGILALSPAQRASFLVGLPILMESQAVQVFGQAAADPELHYQDWALEPETCSAVDLETPPVERPDAGNPMLRRAIWGGKLHWGGAETAAHNAGLIEGALEAGRRVERELVRSWAHTSEPAKASASQTDAATLNMASLAAFNAWVAAQGDAVFDDYRQRLRADLSARQREQLMQRALLGAMEGVFAKALGELHALRFNAIGVEVERGRSSLIPLVQQPFRALMQCAVDDAVAFNQTSCALSNFPDEHRPSKDYMQVVLRDIAAAWQEFSLSANQMLLAKTDARSARLAS